MKQWDIKNSSEETCKCMSENNKKKDSWFHFDM